MHRVMPGFLADCLSRPENSDFILAVETAKEWGVKPMDVLVPLHTRSRFDDLDPDAIANADLALMKAYVILKRESCPRCGTPYWIGHNTDNYIDFEVGEDTCYACKKVEDHNKSQKENSTAVIAYPKLVMLLDHERPTREGWLKSLAGSDE